MIYVGDKFGRLKALHKVGRVKYPAGYVATIWKCVCRCGKTKIVRGGNLTNKSTRSCGCLRDELLHKRFLVHGETSRRNKQTKLYTVWRSMIERCSNPNNTGFHRYGGRGITVCGRWKKKEGIGFVNFRKDMGRPENGMSLERKNNNGNYTPKNCLWATRREQANNRRSNHFVSVGGRKMTIANAERLLGFNGGLINARLFRGWTEARAVSQPVWCVKRSYHK